MGGVAGLVRSGRCGHDQRRCTSGSSGAKAGAISGGKEACGGVRESMATLEDSCVRVSWRVTRVSSNRASLGMPAIQLANVWRVAGREGASGSRPRVNITDLLHLPSRTAYARSIRRGPITRQVRVALTHAVRTRRMLSAHRSHTSRVNHLHLSSRSLRLARAPPLFLAVYRDQSTCACVHDNRGRLEADIASAQLLPAEPCFKMGAIGRDMSGLVHP